MTGWLALSRSPTSCASLNPRGSTTWTRAAVDALGIVRTTLGRGAAGLSSRFIGRTFGPGSGARGAMPTPSSSSGSSTRPRYTIARRHIAAIELPSSLRPVLSLQTRRLSSWTLPVRGSLAEDRPPNPHDRGPFLDCHFVIVTHAHRHLGQAEAPGQLRQGGESRPGIPPGGGDRHQPVDGEAGRSQA